jgi:hypothetical protein
MHINVFLLYDITLILFGKNLKVPHYDFFFSLLFTDLQIFSSARYPETAAAYIFPLMCERPSFKPAKGVQSNPVITS